MVGTPTDAEIIAASLKDGGSAEFSAIYERYSKDIFRYVARRIGHDSAGDVSADVFVAAFEQRRRYDLSRPHCRPWLYGIASNKVRDHLRKQKRRSRAYLRAAGQEAAAETPINEAEARAGAALMVPAINAALGKLNNADRETLLLFALGELSYEEIATALDVPIGTVRSRLSRARKKMQELVPGE